MGLTRHAAPLAATLWLCVAPTWGDTIPAPEGQVILTVTGLDPDLFPGGSVAFDHDLLVNLGLTDVTTSSIWTEGLHVYSGVLLKQLVQTLKVEGQVLRLHALNDYEIEFPSAEATEVAPILAIHQNGQPMSVRDKGPIWVIYPYDFGPEYRTDTTFSRSIWQLDRIDVLP